MYVGLAWHFWNSRWRTRPAGALRAWERAAILVPLALHGWLLYDGVFARELRFGFAQALSVMMFLGVAVYWVEPVLQPRRHAAARAAARCARGTAAGAVPRPRLERRARAAASSSCTSRSP